MSKFDNSPYDVIVFDEIYFASIRMLAKIKRYSELNPHKIILATGDTNQLETIDLVSNQIDYESYTNQRIDNSFPNGMMLQESRRLKSQSDKDTLRQLKADIFNDEIHIIKTIRKYFQFTDEIKTSNNIACKSSTCEGVCIRAKDDEQNERLRCR